MQWFHDTLQVGMPHMVPGQLSEVEMLKHLGDRQWAAISALLGRPSHEIVNDQGERLYASFLSIALSMEDRCFQHFGEGSSIRIRHAANFYAGRFVEGALLFGDADIPDERLPASLAPAAFAGCGVPHIYLTNAFVTREESNLRLRTFAPAGVNLDESATTDELPVGLREHERVQRTGQVQPEDWELGKAVPAMARVSNIYPIVPESDLNGAGLLYFARYVAIMNYGERLALRSAGAVPISCRLISFLTTVKRRLYYFANATESDSVRVDVSVYATAIDENAGSTTQRTPLAFDFVTDLYRVSDGALMAKSIVRKSLSVSQRSKDVLSEANRLRLLWEL
ncbi:MAG: hypothetical protein KDA42_06880 [Planctomycetales bacterium]|nr:hypothetical protein [Planctomycetales bacterium]